jgi:hypothetical protein
MPQNTDDVYVCYGFDVTTTAKRHGIRFSPRLDNTRILHHMILFDAGSSPYSTTPTQCDFSTSVQWRMVYGWAPGAQPLDLPPEAGFPLEGTTHYVMQIHYNNVNHLAGQSDSSGVDICTTDHLRPNDADTLAFGSTSFTVNPRASLDWTCDLTIPSFLGGLHSFAAIPHMHQIGKSISTLQYPGGTVDGGTGIDLGHQLAWNFQTQTWFPIQSTVNGGDLVRTRCIWQNPTDTAVSFGPNTSDEMCFSFTMYYPRITFSGWSWIVPAQQANCYVTP